MTLQPQPSTAPAELLPLPVEVPPVFKIPCDVEQVAASKALSLQQDPMQLRPAAALELRPVPVEVPPVCKIPCDVEQFAASAIADSAKALSSEQAPVPMQPRPSTAPAELCPVPVKMPPVAKILCDVEQVATSAQAVSNKQAPTATHEPPTAPAELTPVPVPPVARIPYDVEQVATSAQQAPTAKHVPSAAPVELTPVPPVAKISYDVEQVATSAQAVSPQQAPAPTQELSTAPAELTPVPVPPVAKIPCASAQTVSPQQAPTATGVPAVVQQEQQAALGSRMERGISADRQPDPLVDGSFWPEAPTTEKGVAASTLPEESSPDCL